MKINFIDKIDIIDKINEDIDENVDDKSEIKSNR